MVQTNIKTAILGLNRQTASMGLALRLHSQKPKSTLNFAVIGCDEDHQKMKAARQLGALDEIQAKGRHAVRGADIVILALPPGKLEAAYEDFGPELKVGAVVLTMGYSQSLSHTLVNQYFPRDSDGSFQAYSVGICPMVQSKYLYQASEEVEDAVEDLFTDSEMIIAPDMKCPEEAVKLASDLANILQMKPRFLSPEEYDGYVDFTEKLPVFLSAALFAALRRSGGWRDLERSINPHFATMLAPIQGLGAADIAALWQDNPQMAVQHLDEMIKILENLRSILLTSNFESLQALSEEIIASFEGWNARRRSGKWDEASRVEMPKKSEMWSNLLGLGALERALERSEKDPDKRRR